MYIVLVNNSEFHSWTPMVHRCAHISIAITVKCHGNQTEERFLIALWLGINISMNTFIILYNKPVMATLGRPRLVLYFITLSNSGNVCQEDFYGMVIFVDVDWSSVICSRKVTDFRDTVLRCPKLSHKYVHWWNMKDYLLSLFIINLLKCSNSYNI